MKKRRELTKACCMCRKVLFNGKWEHRLYDLNNSTHGYCPVCFEISMALIEQKRQQKMRIKIGL